MTPHLRGHVRAYVDRALPPTLLHVYDRHLVCCQLCRSAADQERRIVASLRSDTGIPNSLRSSLMGLALTEPMAQPLSQPPSQQGSQPMSWQGAEPTAGSAVAGESADAAGSWLPSFLPRSGSRRSGSSFTVPGIPMAPAGARMPLSAVHDPVPTVHPTAPALHRSPVRAAVVASIAAGASVAAAWGLAVAPLPGTTRPPSAQVPVGVSSLGSSAFGVASLAATGFMVGSSSRVTAISREQQPTAGRRGGASSTPATYWVVSRTAYRQAQSAPVRVSLIPSAQSSP